MAINDTQQNIQQPIQNQQEQLDPNIKAMVKAIGLQENGGQLPTEQSYLNKGQSGERGLYQFTQPTWNKYAGEILGNSQADLTPENQNQVVYGKIKQWKDQGYTPEQIFSMWNAGEGAPMASSTGLVGTNKYGARYDVKQYADNANKYYQEQLHTENTKEQQTQPENFLKKVMDFAFPIVSDIPEIAQGTSKKTPLQVLGDLGLSALWFVPGIGEAAGAGIKGLGLLGEAGAKIAGQAIGGAATGYGADVASKLAQGETDTGKILTPGLGTATGGALGGILGKVAGKYSQEGILKDITNSNNAILGQTKKGAQELAEAFSKDRDTGALLSHKGINLSSLVNPETVAFDTTDKATQLRNDTQKLSSALSDALKQVPGTANVTSIENEINKNISSFYKDKVTASEATNIVKNEFNNIRQQYGEKLSASDLNDLKQRAWGLSKFDMNTTNLTRNTYRNIGNNLKTLIENGAENAGLKGVKNMNEYIGMHLDAADELDRLNGMKAKGGRLGDLLQKHTMGAIGAASGGIFGGGLPGSILGYAAGEYAGGKISNVLRKIMSSPLKTSILKQMQSEDPQLVQKILQYAQKTPQVQKIQEKIAPFLIPKSQKTGLISQIMPQIGVRAVQQQ